ENRDSLQAEELAVEAGFMAGERIESNRVVAVEGEGQMDGVGDAVAKPVGLGGGLLEAHVEETGFDSVHAKKAETGEGDVVDESGFGGADGLVLVEKSLVEV